MCDPALLRCSAAAAATGVGQDQALARQGRAWVAVAPADTEGKPQSLVWAASGRGRLHHESRRRDETPDPGAAAYERAVGQLRAWIGRTNSIAACYGISICRGPLVGRTLPRSDPPQRCGPPADVAAGCLCSCPGTIWPLCCRSAGSLLLGGRGRGLSDDLCHSRAQDSGGEVVLVSPACVCTVKSHYKPP